MDPVTSTAVAEPSSSSPMGHSMAAPNIVKSDPNERLPDLNQQLDDSLRAAFDSENPPQPKRDPDPIQEESSNEKKEEPKASTPENKTQETKPQTSNLTDPSSIADPKNFSKSADLWKNLKGIASKNFEVANQRAQELDTVKKSFATKEADYKKQIETFQNQINELSGYRAAVDIQADPEFISKYEQPIVKLQTELRSMLKSKGVNDEIINNMDFESSERMAAVVQAIEENSDKLFSKRFGRRVEDLLEINDRKSEELDNWKSNHKTFIEDRKKEALGKRAQTEGQMLKLVEDYANDKHEDGTPKIPFLNKREIAPGLNKDQVKSIEAHNTIVDQMNGKLNSILKADDPESKVEIAIAALAAQWMKWQLDDVSKRLAAKEEELKRISSAGSEGDQKTPTPKRESMNPTITDPKSLDLDNALYNHFGRR